MIDLMIESTEQKCKRLPSRLKEANFKTYHCLSKRTVSNGDLATAQYFKFNALLLNIVMKKRQQFSVKNRIHSCKNKQMKVLYKNTQITRKPTALLSTFFANSLCTFSHLWPQSFVLLVNIYPTDWRFDKEKDRTPPPFFKCDTP